MVCSAETMDYRHWVFDEDFRGWILLQPPVSGEGGLAHNYLIR